MNELATFLPILIYLVILIGFVIGVLAFAHLIAPPRSTAVKDMPYESGMDPIGDARQHFDIKYYLVAILFLIFDMELLFLYPWAVSAYQDGGIEATFRGPVFVGVLVFLALLAIGYVYEWRKGGFRWR
jgi:NADH:ubiquinone oxidoreductase subunit 3 (subunit A)